MASVRVYLVTRNRHKLLEAREALKGYPVELEMAGIGKLEIQGDNVESIALAAARHAYRLTGRPVAVDDTSLEVKALSGFPGPYASYVYKTLGVRGLLKLMEGVEDRRACFRTALAVIIPPYEKVFVGEVCGEIAREAKGRRGFGFDPIFVPEGADRTFAEMSLEEKNEYSHRAKAFRAMGEWVAETYSYMLRRASV